MINLRLSITFLSFLITVFLTLEAQEVEVDWIPIEEMSKSGFGSKDRVWASDRYYACVYNKAPGKGGSGNKMAEIFDLTSDNPVSHRINLRGTSDPVESWYANHLVAFNGKFYVVKSEEMDGKASNSILTSEESPEVLIENINVLHNPNRENVIINQVGVSPNHSYLAVASFTLLPYESQGVFKTMYNSYKNPREEEFYVRKRKVSLFDKDFNLVFEKEFDLGEMEKGEYIMETHVLNDGTIILQVERSPIRVFYMHLSEAEKIFDEKNPEVSGKEDVYYTLSKDSDEPNEMLTVDLNEHNVFKSWSFNDGEHVIHVSSAGEVKSSFGGNKATFEGFQVTTISPSKAESHMVNATPWDFRNTFTKRQERKLNNDKGLEIGKPQVRSAQVLDDGSVSLIFEEEVLVEKKSGSYTFYDYIFQYATVFNIEAEKLLSSRVHDEHWQRIDQEDDYNRGGLFARSNGESFVTISNSTGINRDSFKGKKANKLKMYRFSETGELMAEFDLQNRLKAINPKDCDLIDDNILLVASDLEDEDKVKLGLVKLPK